MIVIVEARSVSTGMGVETPLLQSQVGHLDTEARSHHASSPPRVRVGVSRRRATELAPLLRPCFAVM